MKINGEKLAREGGGKGGGRDVRSQRGMRGEVIIGKGSKR